MQLLGRIVSHAWQQARAEGAADGLRVLFGAGRVVGARGRLAELFAIPSYLQLLAAEPGVDPLFFISHRHFLSRDLCIDERWACALDHFRFKQSHFSPALLAVMHHDGLPLWRDPTGYEVRLCTNTETRHEGPISLELRFGDAVVHEFSLAWIEASRLGDDAGHGPVLFATRNQSMPSDAPLLARFRHDFPQNSPAYFVFAALNGLAHALGQSRIVGIRDTSQIAFETDYATSFRHSYDYFWLGFGGRPLARHGFVMPVPVVVTPLAELQSKHRARARQRREHWREIAESAQASLGLYLRR